MCGPDLTFKDIRGDVCYAVGFLFLESGGDSTKMKSIETVKLKPLHEHTKPTNH